MAPGQGLLPFTLNYSNEKAIETKAKEQLGRAIDIYKECGADGWVTKAEEELARL